MFGSFKTNLYLPTSDIDLVVVDSSWRIPPFFELKDELIAHNICDREKVIVLDNASVSHVYTIYTSILNSSCMHVALSLLDLCYVNFNYYVCFGIPSCIDVC